MKVLLIVLTSISCLAVSCNSPAPAPKIDAAVSPIAPSKTDIAEKNKATTLAMMESFNNHTWEGMAKYHVPEPVDYGDGSSPPIKGKEAIQASLQGLFTTFPDMKSENFNLIAEGNQVALFCDDSGTFKGAMMGIKPTGKSFKLKVAHLLTFNDAGLITEHRIAQSKESIMQQVGVVMKK